MVEVGVFRRGWVTLSAVFTGKGASPTNHSWYQSSRVIALSCGIKISAVRHLVLSQCTRVTDGLTDRQTDRITTPKTALAYAHAVKKTTPNCDVLFANGELHQAYGYVTLTTSGHKSLVGCRLPRLCSYSWLPFVCRLIPWVVLFFDDFLCLRSWHRTSRRHDFLLPHDITDYPWLMTYDHILVTR